MLNADVVIVSVQYILANKHFLNMPAGPAAASQLYYLSRRPGGSLSLSLPVIYFANDARLYHGVFPTKSSSLLSE